MSTKSKWWIFILVSLAIIIALSSLQHFIYDWLPNPFFATFAPISESVWEHLKIVFYPFVITWVVSYFIVHKRLKLSIKKMLFAAAIGATTACFLVVFLFYLIHSGLGIAQNTIIEIGVEIVSIFVGQLVAWHIAKREKQANPIISVAIIFIWVIAFIVLSFITPNAPIFIE